MSDKEKEDRKNRITVAVGFVNYLHSRGYSIGEAVDTQACPLECCSAKSIARLIAEFSNDCFSNDCG